MKPAMNSNCHHESVEDHVHVPTHKNHLVFILTANVKQKS